MNIQNYEKQRSMDKDTGITDLRFPFIRCQNSSHTNYGPQTVLSYFSINSLDETLFLLCNNCVKQRSYQQNNHYEPADIEEFVENYLGRISKINLDIPKAPSALSQSYFQKQERLNDFQKRVQEEIQIIKKTHEDVIQELIKFINERRDNLIKATETFYEIYEASYNIFSHKYDRLYCSQEKCRHMSENGVKEIKGQLKQIKTPEEYEKFVGTIFEFSTLMEDLQKLPVVTEELVNFNAYMENFHMQIPQQKYISKSKVSKDLKAQIDGLLVEFTQEKAKGIEQILGDLNSSLEKEKSKLSQKTTLKSNSVRELLQSIIQLQSKKFENLQIIQQPINGPAQIENDFQLEISAIKEPAKEIKEDCFDANYNTDLDMDLYNWGTPGQDGEDEDQNEYEEEESGEILSVAINDMADLDQLGGTDIKHFEILSSSINDNLAIEIGRAVLEIRSLASITFDFCGGDNQLTDNGAKQLLNAIRKHKKVRTLLLDFSEGKNLITDDTAKHLGEVLQDLQDLDMLFVNFCCGKNQITDDGFIHMSESIKDLSGLTNLRVNMCGGDNMITDDGAKAFALAVENLPNLNFLLIKLCCNKNKVGEEGHVALSKSLTELKYLVSLTIATSGEHLNDQVCEYMAESFFTLNNLRELTVGLYENAITNEGVEKLGKALGVMSQLISLRLNVCGGSKAITDEGINYISQGLSKLQKLSAITLSFYDNVISDKGVESIAYNIQSLEQLNTFALNLHGSALSDKGVSELAKSLQGSKKLNSLALIFSGLTNPITDEGAKLLFQAFTKLNLIEYLTLDLSKNMLTNQGASELGNILSQHTQLSELTLCLDENKIEEEGAIYLCQCIEKLKNLKSIMVFFARNPIHKEIWEKVTKSMREALPQSEMSIRW